jgi:flagellar motility protein MotE (MotC chaperone)
MAQNGQQKSEEREEQRNRTENKKDLLSVQERVKLLEEQIKQKNEEYLKLTDVVEKLKIINTLLYKEVCKEYNTLSINLEEE